MIFAIIFLQRYFYYLQLRQNVQDGVLCCSEEEAITLASYALQGWWNEKSVVYT